MRSSLYTFFNIELLLAILFISSYPVASRSHGNKKIITKETKESKEVDICNIENRHTPIICYCTAIANHNIDVQNATKINASCLILEKLERSNSIWNYFTSQTYIEQLTFTVRFNDSFDYVPSQMLRQLNNLRVVKFRYAKLDELAERAFSNLVSVQEISLKRNTIVVLHKYAFENMRNLTVIDLGENHISEINRDAFVNLPILRSLHLNRNNISIVHDRAFKYLNSLRELELNDNQITVVKRDNFHGLSNLLRLDLSNNLISMIGERSFVEMPVLAELNLDQNQIEYISERALDGMRNLRKLLLSENQLVTLSSDFLVGAPGVNFLDLRKNVLKTMTFDSIKPIVFNLYSTDSQFYLNDNRLICDCKLAWIWGLRNETKSTKLKDALKELICILEIDESQKINSEETQRKITQSSFKKYFENNSRNNNNETDESHYDESFKNSSSNLNFYDKIHGKDKLCCVKHLFELQPEKLPCSEFSREDPITSKQPFIHHETDDWVNSSGSNGISFSLTLIQSNQFVFVVSVLPSLSILFFT